MKALAALALLALCGCTSITNVEFANAIAPALQADMPTAIARLEALSSLTLGDRQQRVRSCMLERFGSGAAAPADATVPAPVAAVLRAYRQYWTDALTQRESLPRAEAELSAKLRVLVGEPAESIAARTLAARQMVERHGLYALGGVTQPLHELMIWRDQDSRRETIALPGGAFDISVNLLDDFVSLGWAAWATCDSQHTGGWTTSAGIMVVKRAWDLGSENYRVSLLAHEAQHYRDGLAYPKLAQPDLEFRAKLVELAMAIATQRELLVKFESEAKRERALPHSFASYWVVERLRARLGGEPRSAAGPAIRDAAIAELAAHGAALESRGGSSVTTALPD